MFESQETPARDSPCLAAAKSYTSGFLQNREKCNKKRAGYPHSENREKRENGQKKSLSGKTQGIWKVCQNTGNSVCPSYKFPVSKIKRYFIICCKNFPKFLKLDMSAKSVLCI